METPAEVPGTEPARNRRAVVLGVLAVLVAVRLAFIAAFPDAHSADVASYVQVARLLEVGRNPYNETNILCWPPFWLQGIYVLDRIALATGVPFVRVLQAFLVGVDGAIAGALFVVLGSVFRVEARAKLVLLGLALDPVSVLVTCQHSNVESVTGLWSLLAVGFLVAWRRSGDPVHWLAACLAVGLGALEKSIPIVLAPLLLLGIARLRPLARGLGALLVLGPAGLGLSVVYVLGPGPVFEHVVHYRSMPGYFGFTGILHLLGADGLVPHWTKVFLLVLAGTAAFTGRLALREKLTDARVVLAAYLLVGCVPTFGPGFGPQYACLLLPLLVVSYSLFGPRWRRLLLAVYGVAAATYVVEYALTPALGAFYLHVHPTEGAARLAAQFALRGAQTLACTPLFLALLATFFEAVRMLREDPGATAPAP